MHQDEDPVSVASVPEKGKMRLLTREHLDGRTRARKQFDAIASGIAQDLGGSDQLSTIEKHLTEAFAGIAVCVNDMNARIMLGQDFDILSLSNAVSTMVRIGSRLGTKRIAKDVFTPPNVADYVEYAHQQDDEAS